MLVVQNGMLVFKKLKIFYFILYMLEKYQILQIELARVGAQNITENTLAMMDLSNPDLDFVKIAEGMGVSASRANTADEFNEQLALAMGDPGPRLIEALMVD